MLFMLSVELYELDNSLRMRNWIGALVLCLTIYTAKSLFVGGKSGETFDDDIKLQRLSDEENEIFQSKIKFNPLSTSTATPPSTTSFFSFKKLNRLSFPLRSLNEESTEDGFDNEIESNDVIEIEVPMIGSEYMRIEKNDQIDEDLKVNEANTNSKGFVDFDIFTVQATSDIQPTQTQNDDIVTFPSDFQTSPNDQTTQETIRETNRETDHQNDIEVTTQIDTETSTQTTSSSLVVDGHEVKRELREDNYIESFQTIESKLMEQWKPAYNMMNDGSIESKVFTLATDKSRRPKFPFNVKVIVNNEDEKQSCKSKKSCNQVSFSQRKSRDIDPQFYVDYSSEDFGFNSERDRFFKLPDEQKSRNARRAADDAMNFLPAPRFPKVPAIKKPAFIEKLENESSLERSERIDKQLNDFTKFVSVWAQVDKFVSDRTREFIKKVAHISGDSDYDYVVGSKRRIETRRANDDPFT